MVLCKTAPPEDRNHINTNIRGTYNKSRHVGVLTMLPNQTHTDMSLSVNTSGYPYSKTEFCLHFKDIIWTVGDTAGIELGARACSTR